MTDSIRQNSDASISRLGRITLMVLLFAAAMGEIFGIVVGARAGIPLPVVVLMPLTWTLSGLFFGCWILHMATGMILYLRGEERVRSSRALRSLARDTPEPLVFRLAVISMVLRNAAFGSFAAALLMAVTAMILFPSGVRIAGAPPASRHASTQPQHPGR